MTAEINAENGHEPDQHRPLNSTLITFPSPNVNVIKMVKTQPTMENLLTIVFAPIDPLHYTEKMLHHDLLETCKFFSMKVPNETLQFFFQDLRLFGVEEYVINALKSGTSPLDDSRLDAGVKSLIRKLIDNHKMQDARIELVTVKSETNDPNVINAQDAGENVRRIMNDLKFMPIDKAQKIRFVHIGNSPNRLVFEAYKVIVREWQASSKFIQYVGKHENKLVLNFWKSICNEGLCNEVEYFITDDYFPFGEFKPPCFCEHSVDLDGE